METRAYSTFQIKSVDAERRVIEGIASTPSPDRGGDVMEPSGAQFSLPMPFLWKHKDPIGEVFEATVRKDGIHIKARISTLADNAPVSLKDRLEEAWHSIKSKPPLARGLSIGWNPIQSELIKGTQFVRHIKWIWAETSAVVVPMNVECSISNVKSFDTGHAAPGSSSAVGSRPAGASASAIREAHKGAPVMQNYSEQLSDAQTELQTKSAAMEALMNRSDAEGGFADDSDDAKELNTLTSHVKTLTQKVERLSTLEAAMGQKAQPLQFSPRQTVTTPRIEVKNLPPGTRFARYAMAIAAGKGSLSDTLAYAKRWDGQTPEVTQYIKAVTGISTSTSPGWGSELVFQDNLASEFVELMRPMTVLGKLTGIRKVPFNVRIPVQSSGSTVNWVGEVGVKPVTELDFTTVTLGYDKIAGIVVMSEELIRLSTPSAEETVRRDLTDEIAQFIDEQFLSPSVAAGANNPASITNGVTSPAATGSDITAVFTDLNNALATFDNANLGTESVHIVLPPHLARGISTMRNALGMAEFDQMSPTGGTLMGYPVIVSGNVPVGHVILIKANEILLADDGRVTLDASNQATIDMAGGATPNFNLWQRNCVGIRAERWITWAKKRSTAVAVIDTANYGPGGSP